MTRNTSRIWMAASAGIMLLTASCTSNGLNFGATASTSNVSASSSSYLDFGNSILPGFNSRNICGTNLSSAIPRRSNQAGSGSAVINQVMNMGGPERDAVLTGQIMSGNIPSFMRHLIPVTFSGRMQDGQTANVTICVTPDYLAVGDDNDYVRVPMGLPSAALIADQLGFFLPTPKMVDAIYDQAQIHLAPSPMQAGSMMTSTSYLAQHDQTVDGQRAVFMAALDELTAGQKKDLVLTTRLQTHPGQVAIYGWHRPNGSPIQPLSTVHEAVYADYSHGVRLVSATAYLNGQAIPLGYILQDPELAPLVSNEGPIALAEQLQTSLYQ